MWTRKNATKITAIHFARADGLCGRPAEVFTATLTLPGSYVESNASLYDAAIRDLKQLEGTAGDYEFDAVAEFTIDMRSSELLKKNSSSPEFSHSSLWRSDIATELFTAALLVSALLGFLSPLAIAAGL